MYFRVLLKKLFVIISLLDKKQRNKYKIQKLVSKILPESSVYDIGASYFPHGKWNIFRGSAGVNWIAVDPNEENLSYTKKWNYNSKIITVPRALSPRGGSRILYKTNIDSGSSLKRPEINENWKHRVNIEYFFPLKEIQVDTLGINELMYQYGNTNPCCMKIDIQGLEFDLIKAIDKKNLKNVLAFELENTMQAIPIMKGSAQFDTVYNFMINNDFELALIDPISSTDVSINKNFKSSFILNECDFVFVSRFDTIPKKSIDECFFMLGVYYSYNLFAELKELAKIILEKKNPSNLQKDILNKILNIF